MSQTQSTIAYESQAAYEHQLIYAKKKEKRNIILGYVLICVNVIAAVLACILPMYKYNYVINKQNINVTGKKSMIKWFSDYFANNLNGKSLLNTLAFISLIVIAVSIVYLIAACTISALKKENVSIYFDYTSIEIIATIEVIALFVNMVTARVDVAGCISNEIGFIILTALACLSIFISIVLVKPRNKKD